MKKILLSVSGIVGALALLANKTYAQVSTTTVGANIDSVTGAVQEYFGVLIEKYWPFLVGFIILLSVWLFGKRILQAFR